MTTKKLFKGTPNELRITEKNNKIIVENKEDIRLKELREQELKFLCETGLLIISSFLLGVCLTYLITK